MARAVSSPPLQGACKSGKVFLRRALQSWTSHLGPFPCPHVEPRAPHLLQARARSDPSLPEGSVAAELGVTSWSGPRAKGKSPSPCKLRPTLSSAFCFPPAPPSSSRPLQALLPTDLMACVPMCCAAREDLPFPLPFGLKQGFSCSQLSVKLPRLP